MALSLALSCEGSFDTSTIVQVVEKPRTFAGSPEIGSRLIFSDSRLNGDMVRIYWFRGPKGLVTMSAEEAHRTLAEVQGPRRWVK